ncbi:MAG: hypothetical protein Q9218_001479 [Villophora microphyllina]
MSERKLRAIRVVSVIAATVIALACGTNYAYSAWGPQFAERMQLSSTQQNLIGTFANLGMYCGGIPVGILVDTKGPQPGVIIGGGLLASGYFGSHRAFESGPGSIALPWLCLFAFMTGIGGASAFSGSIKTFPHSQQYTPVSVDEERRSSNPLVRTKSTERKRSSPRYDQEPGTQQNDSQASTLLHRGSDGKSETVETQEPSDNEPDETSSLMSKSTSSSPGDVPYRHDGAKSTPENDSYHVDIRGLILLKQVEFYQLWFLLGILTGVGLMTINASPVFVQKRQLRHVMLLSVFSCVGRLCSGIGSDLIVKKLHASRFWCLFVSSSIFCVAQICGSQIGNPHLLGFVSGITGLAYGFLFGVYPSLVAETFGIKGLSQNWGAMTLSPIVFGNIFNLLYGRIYDHHSYVHDGHRTCLEGLECYRRAYWMTLGGSLLAVVISLWSIRYAGVKQMRRNQAERNETRDA